MIDPNSGFLANLQSFVLIPQEYEGSEEGKEQYLYKYGTSLNNTLKSLIKGKILQKLQSNRMLNKSHHYGMLPEEFEQKHTEPIYKICCSLMDKTLSREIRHKTN